MSASASIAASPSTPASASASGLPSHTAIVRVTHWITAACFSALLVSGLEIVVSHPRFYWGETGTVLEQPLFSMPIPSSRSSEPTSYGYVLPDQNGWSRSLHFQAAWLLVLAGVVYVAAGLRTRHFQDDLLPARHDVTARAILHAAAKSLRPATATEAGEWAYNGLQRLTYLGVVFGLFPLVVWTGLAMSDAYYSTDPESWETIDIAEALHPQTLVAWGMNGADLPVGFGGPLRLRVPRQLGYKSVKYVVRVDVRDDVSTIGKGLGGANPEYGYAWYAGI